MFCWKQLEENVFEKTGTKLRIYTSFSHNSDKERHLEAKPLLETSVIKRQRQEAHYADLFIE